MVIFFRGCLNWIRFFNSLILNVNYPVTCLPLESILLIVERFYLGSSPPIQVLQINFYPEGNIDINLCSGLIMNELKGCRDTPSDLCVTVRLRVTDEERGEKGIFVVSHSKLGFSEGQGAFQQTGSRSLKLQVRQEG